MPEVLGQPPSPRTALFWNGAAWQWALVDAQGHLQIDVQTILGLEGALRSVGTDRLMVRGENQLFSYRRPLASVNTTVISGADGFVNSLSPPDGIIWIVTNVAASDRTSPTTEHRYYLSVAMGAAYFYRQTEALAQNIPSVWNGLQALEHDDFIQVYLMGGLGADNGRVELSGYEMTREA